MHVVYHTLQIEPSLHGTLSWASRTTCTAYAKRSVEVEASLHDIRNGSQTRSLRSADRLKVMRSGSTARQIASEYLNPIRECFPNQHRRRRYISFSLRRKKSGVTISYSTLRFAYHSAPWRTVSEIQIFKLVMSIWKTDMHAKYGYIHHCLSQFTVAIKNWKQFKIYIYMKQL